jgi:proteasome lid subunit RPN8/RPN11
MLRFQQSTLDELHAHAQETYPEECCGFVLTDGETETVRRIRNVQNAMHTRYPEEFTRDAKTAYFMDPKELFTVQREIENGEWELKAMYHSHPDHDAYFSPEDKKVALGGGDEPMYPGVVYLVMSIYDRQIRSMRAVEWDDEEQDFVEIRVGSPQRGNKKKAGS